MVVQNTGIIVFKGNTTLLRNRASWKGGGAFGGVAGMIKSYRMIEWHSKVAETVCGGQRCGLEPQLLRQKQVLVHALLSAASVEC